MIVVMGATGRIGRGITELLLEAGHPVRALGRSESKLAELKRAGAEIAAGDAADPGFLAGGFRGADAVYALLPYGLQETDYFTQQRRLGEATVEAVRWSGMSHVVFLSSVGADRPSGTGLIASLHEQEQRLRALKHAHVLILRPGSFFENFSESLGLIREHGVYADAVAPELPIPMVGTADIAAAAARALGSRDWTGVVVRELLGPRDLSYAEATRIIGEHIGQPELQYVQLSYTDMVGTLTGIGFSAHMAGLYVDVARGINEGRVATREGRTEANTTPTPFERFAGELAREYSAA